MSSFIASARSQLQLITEHRAGGTRSAFRSALSLHFAINPFHTIPHHHHHHHPPLHSPHTLAHSISLPMFILSPLYLHLSTDFSFYSAFSLKSFFSPSTMSTHSCLLIQRLYEDLVSETSSIFVIPAFIFNASWFGQFYNVLWLICTCNNSLQLVWNVYETNRHGNIQCAINVNHSNASAWAYHPSVFPIHLIYVTVWAFRRWVHVVFF